MHQKIRILIVDDKNEEVEDLKSFIIPARQPDNLFWEEKNVLIDKLFTIKVLNSVPDGLEYIKLQLPDIAIVDINFEEAPRHLIMTDEREEGILLIEKLSIYESVATFCVSNYVDTSLDRIVSLGKGDWAFRRQDLRKFTLKIGEVLRDFAKRELASIQPEMQQKLAEHLDTDNWQELMAKAMNRNYYLKDLMAGWATLALSEDTAEPYLEFPFDIVDIIKSLLPYAYG